MIPTSIEAIIALKSSNTFDPSTRDTDITNSGCIFLRRTYVPIVKRIATIYAVI